MINQPRWNLLQTLVDYCIRTDHHRIAAFLKDIDNTLQRLRRRVKIVGIELHGILSAAGRMNCFIPAAADVKIATLRNQVSNFRIQGGKLLNCFCCAVGGMIIHDNDIEVEICFLGKRALQSILNGFAAVEHRNDYTGLYGKTLIRRSCFFCACGQISSAQF